MIRVEKLSKKFKSGKKTVCALDSVSTEFGETGLVCVVGKSGCGKTTFLNCLSTLDSPTGGAVYFKEADGEEICLTALSKAYQDEFRNSRLGIVFQDFNLINEWTVLANLRIVFDIQQWEEKSREDIDERITEVLKFVELEDIQKRYIKELSGGEQQRVAIARGIIKNPKLLFADEPTGNLDSQNSETVMKLLKKCSESCLVIVVTHDMEMASAYADRIICMKDGKIVSDNLNASQKESDAGTLPKRSSVAVKRMSAATVFNLAFHSLWVKKLKMFFSLLVLVAAMCLGKVCATFLCNDVGKAVSEYLLKNDKKFLYAYESCEYVDRDTIEKKVDVKNRSRLKGELISKFGEENCFSVMEYCNVEYKDESCECKLVISGAPKEGREFIGEMPKEKDEIAITDYLVYKMNMPESCIGDTLMCDGIEMKITGIIVIGTKEYAESIEGISLDALYPEGSRLIVSEKYPELLAEQKSLKMSFAGLSGSAGVEEEMESVYSVTSVSGLGEKSYEVVSGRLPENDSEVAVSVSYAEYDLFTSDLSEIENGNFGFADIHNKNRNGVFDGYFSFYDMMPDVRIVGIVDEDTADIIFTDATYAGMAEQYTQKYCADSYEVLLNEDTVKKSQIYTDLYKKGIILDMEEMEIIYSETEILRKEFWIFEIGLCVTGIILILLLILVFSFNVKDNHVKIGILKSLGVSDIDITRIWVAEAMMITALTWILSFAANIIIFLMWNKHFKNSKYFLSSLIHHNLWTESVEFFIIFVLAIAAVVMPIWIMTDKKPMELIRSRS